MVMADNLRKRIQKAISRMKLEDLENLFWYLTVEGLVWKEVIQMYLIGRKGVWTNRNEQTFDNPHKLSFFQA